MITVLIIAVTLCGEVRVCAESGACGYEVAKIDMRVNVNKDHSCEVEEFISVDISEDLSEIRFNMPDGVYRITDHELLTAGRHRYTINYTIRERMDQDREKDHFCFYVIHPEWEKPAAYVHALIAFPYGFPLEDIYSRATINGKPDNRDPFDHKPEVSSQSYTVTGREIPENYSYCLEADLPEGYWEDPGEGSWASSAIVIAAACIACFFFIAVCFRKGIHRRHKS